MFKINAESVVCISKSADNLLKDWVVDFLKNECNIDVITDQSIGKSQEPANSMNNLAIDNTHKNCQDHQQLINILKSSTKSVSQNTKQSVRVANNYNSNACLIQKYPKHSFICE
ncbi:hypothetical protein BpHYR1_050708 [Brachionus plicatilis]|uniref:Uncharacterized protein n=1 Tax=Brachionus plicatilis TaxID=10195 RepID=A0A3M7PBG3_BRAPC|nr:hypothetical protein BpHYR1_050708 [Brachionus plicatilis]